mmetsp:Transcript_19376/g.43304  ORF Transcript_19376/g.43304 Transcript_19376/m.43304 type:complete len:84 (+) Transcript_19376:119-370(+)
MLPKAPQLLELKDDEGWTPLHHCSAQGHVELSEWLLEQGAVPTRVMVTHAADHVEVTKLLKRALKRMEGGSSSASGTAASSAS